MLSMSTSTKASVPALFVAVVVVSSRIVHCEEAPVKEPAIYVRKCCPERDVAHWSRDDERKVQCLERADGLGPDWDWTGNFTEFTDEGMVIAKEKPKFIAEYGLPNCDIPTVLYPDLQPESETSDDFAIFTDGSFLRSTGHSIRRGMYCVDRFVSGVNFTSTMRGALVCDESMWNRPMVESVAFNGSASFRKCCKENQVFSSIDEKCVDHELAWEAFPVHDSRNGEKLNVTLATTQFDVLATSFRNDCLTITPNVLSHDGSHPFYVLETGHLYFPVGLKGGNEGVPSVYSSEKYCIDVAAFANDHDNKYALTQTVLICELTEAAKLANHEAGMRARAAMFKEASCAPSGHNKTVCALKCCAEGRLLAVSDRGAVCEPISGDQERWRPIFHDDDLHAVDLSPWSYKVLDAFQPACKNGLVGTLPQFPDSDPEQAMYLLTNGQVYSKKYDRRFSGPEYCMDYFRSGGGDPVNITLLCFPDQPEDEPIFYVYGVCLIVSSVFLILTLILSLILPDSNRLSTWTMLSFISSLLVASLLLAMMQLFQTHLAEGLCVGFAFVTYYSFLSAFVWLNVMSFDIWYTVKRNLPSTRTHMPLRYLKRCSYAFGVPFLLTAVLLIFQFVPGIPASHFTVPVNPESRCWFRNDWTIGVFFYGPIALILIANVVFFSLTARYLILHRKNTQNLNMQQSTKKRLGLFARLFVVMGVSWMAEVISWKAGPQEIWYVTDLVNALTGILVFVVVICRRRTLKDLRKIHPFFRFILPCGKDGGSTAAGGSSGQHHTRVTDSSGKFPANENGKKFSVSMAGATQETLVEDDAGHNNGHPIGMTTFNGGTAPARKEGHE